MSDNTTGECVRCVMNNRVDPELVLDEHGICNHCVRYDRLLTNRVLEGEEGEVLLGRRVTQIKERRRGGAHDVLIGVSGGTDSTYVALKVKQLGLKPFAVHLDNGWNSEVAKRNMHRTFNRLGIDFGIYRPNAEEFRDLQLSFLKASTPDGEIPTDHAIQATLWKTAEKLGIGTIVSGMNFRTEAVSVPHWAYGHSDWRYIQDVHRSHGQCAIRHYPHFTLRDLARVNAKGIRTLSILNYMRYDKAEAQKEIVDELGWEDYGGKHYESVYTRFFQGVILPVKFGIDKRYGHYSDLINAGQMTRQAALESLKSPTYSPELQDADKSLVLERFGLSDSEFEDILHAPPRSFRDFRNSYRQVQFLRSAVNQMRGLRLYDF